jgi:uncharacterized membrane protein YqjE
MNKNPFDDFVDTPPSSKSGGRPFSQIFQDIVNHLTEIVRSEIRLARVEVRQDIANVSKASAFLIVGAVLVLYAFGFVLLGLTYAIATSVAPWLSALIVGLGVGLFAAIFLLIGRKKMKEADLKPVKTINSVQENVTWMKKRVT